MNSNDFASSSSPSSTPTPTSTSGTSRSAPRKRRNARAEVEALEGRTMLTGGLGNNFALTTGQIANPGDVATVPISVSASQFKTPRGSLVIGVDVADQNGGSLKPRIAVVNDSQGNPLPSAAANPGTLHASLVRVKITPRVRAPRQEVKIVGGDSTATGDFVTGFYLPGDVNGDGLVSANDVSVVRAIQGVKASQQNYIFDADADRNGTIDQQDLKIAQENLGVRTSVLPVISADLTPQSDSGKIDRITNIRRVIFKGTASPGTRITYSEESDKIAPVTTIVGGKGTYQLQITLADGENLPNVRAQDPFGQSFVGRLAAVTFDPNAPADNTPTPTPTPTPVSTPTPAPIQTAPAATTPAVSDASIQANINANTVAAPPDPNASIALGGVAPSQ